MKKYIDEDSLNSITETLVSKDTTINGKALTDNITLTLEDIGLSSEIWTFTLNDDSTVTKEVVVK